MYTAENGTPFNVRIVQSGDTYGRDLCLIHKGEPMIEFYDARYPELSPIDTQWGQFVSRYYLSTLKESNTTPPTGINLQGGVPAWTIDRDTLQTIIHDVSIFA